MQCSKQSKTSIGQLTFNDPQLEVTCEVAKVELVLLAKLGAHSDQLARMRQQEVSFAFVTYGQRFVVLLCTRKTSDVADNFE